jgi:hypothetical protein
MRNSQGISIDPKDFPYDSPFVTHGGGPPRADRPAAPLERRPDIPVRHRGALFECSYLKRQQELIQSAACILGATALCGTEREFTGSRTAWLPPFLNSLAVFMAGISQRAPPGLGPQRVTSAWAALAHRRHTSIRAAQAGTSIAPCR